MDLIQNLAKFLKKSTKEIEKQSPEGTCPLCWGYQEYDHKIRQLSKDKQIDVNNHRYNYMKIQKFMVKYIDGIRLKKALIRECPTCGNIVNPSISPIKELSKKMNMKVNKPIKRSKSLQPLSRDHHHSLLLCWKIRVGFSNNVELKRIKQYADWFFEHHIIPHFDLEEKYLFPILGNQNDLVKKAISEHKRLIRLFTDSQDIKKSLSLIEEELEKHIRFEERLLFNEVQKAATEEQLVRFTKLHADEKFVENKHDEFWNERK